MTVRLPGQDKRPVRVRPSGNAATLLALAFVLAVVLGFAVLVLAILPFSLKVVIYLMAGGVGFLGLHYITWGRWMAAWLQDDPPADSDDPPIR